MSSSHCLQDIVKSLHDFWAGHGCTIWHPHGEKMGAGTMNPATFLRVLGPEPWNVGYVEPSFRADDGRYAENPNRMQMHTQYQVILKPDPGNPQELYLASLTALGLDRSEHDIRFVEDNWESPALGAWGLGWEVWLDGQEITQFTYFQQAGGQALHPVSVEITYGLERIAMFLQGRADVWSIEVDGRHSYADLYRTHEVEHSRYNFDVASVERLQTLHGLYRAEAAACLQQGLIYLAYDYLLRQSHNFNLLDARGAIGVTERAQFFGDMRKQAREVAALYMADRERQEYPFLSDVTDLTAIPSIAADAPVPTLAENTGTALLLVEVGVEELPAHEVIHGLNQLRKQVPSQLAAHRLNHGPVTVSGTVRRFVIQVADLAVRQPDAETLRRGPSLKVSFHRDGTPSRAAEGFARSCGLPVDALIRQGDHLYARTVRKGRATVTVLPEVLTQILDDLRWSKSMRWNDSAISFPRPVRWLLALLDSVVVPWSWAGVTARATTRGPRFLETQQTGQNAEPICHEVTEAAAYRPWLKAQGVILDRAARQDAVLRQVNQAAAQLGGVVQTEDDLLAEVTDLIEAPRVVAGTFPKEYLDLPVSVLITVMRKHQRYFPVYRTDDPTRLLPHFLTVVNGLESQDPDIIRAGNESVVNARFADAAFFIQRDLATSLDEMRTRLQTLTFHARLGTMWDKVQRMTALVPIVSDLVGLDMPERTVCERAAALCKLDLVMQMVVEMTSLQGIMMEFYARAQGEPEAVCQAIREHYQPRTADDDGPAGRPGLVLSIVDRLDSLTGLMAAGVRARGNADPFGLRRTGLGLVKILLQSKLDFDLQVGITAAARLHDIACPPDIEHAVLTFLHRRLQALMREQALPLDVIETVTAHTVINPVHAMRVARDLAAMAGRPAWKETLMAYVRCVRILPKGYTAEATADMKFEVKVERDLYQQIQTALQRLRRGQPAVMAFQAEMVHLRPLIEEFFEAVMVLTDDRELRRSRLRLMYDIRSLGLSLGDLTRLQT